MGSWKQLFERPHFLSLKYPFFHIRIFGGEGLCVFQ